MILENFPFCMEVMEEYSDLREEGNSATMAVRLLKEEYAAEWRDADDGALFFLGIAAAQAARHERLAEVARRVEKSLETLAALGLAGEDIAEIRDFLQNPPPKPAGRRERKPVKPYDWQVGDVFAIPMDSPEAREAHLDDTTLLLRVIGFSEPLRGLCYPYLYRMIWLEPKLPETVEDLNRAGYLCSRVDKPWEPKRPPEHRVWLTAGNREEFLNEIGKLSFVGNFADARDPEDDPMSHPIETPARIARLQQDACYAFHSYGIDYF